jgi:hypothetical protein
MCLVRIDLQLRLRREGGKEEEEKQRGLKGHDVTSY